MYFHRDAVWTDFAGAGTTTPYSNPSPAMNRIGSGDSPPELLSGAPGGGAGADTVELASEKSTPIIAFMRS